MDGYGQPPIGRNFYSYNLLRPSYHQEQQFGCDYSFDDGFGFDPSPSEQIMHDQSLFTADLLGARTYQMPYQLSPASLQQQNEDQAKVLTGQNSGRHVLSPIAGAGHAPAVSRYKEKSEDEPRTTNHSMAKRRRDKAPAIKPSVSPKWRKDSAKRNRRSSSTSQSSNGSSGVDKHRELSLEKNRVAAAKCRIKKKERNEQMVEESRMKAKENQQLRTLVRTMELEMHTLTTVLSAHSNSSDCKKLEETKETLRIFQEADTSKRYPDLCDGSSPADTPALSYSGKSISSVSDSRSPSTPSSSAIQTPSLDLYLLGDKDDEDDMDIDSTSCAGGSED